jgi:hypothetical protein
MIRENLEQGDYFMTGQKPQGTEIKCFSCRHFYITYDRSFPYGCKMAGFKSRLMPSREMYVNSGLECLFFEEKKKNDRKDG